MLYRLLGLVVCDSEQALDGAWSIRLFFGMLALLLMRLSFRLLGGLLLGGEVVEVFLEEGPAHRQFGAN